MAPPGKHRELQPSGLGEWDGFADKDLRNALISGGLATVPVIGTLLALISNYTNSTKSLPIALEFDASLDDDTRKALLKGKYNRHGELSGILQNLADQAYQEMGWTRAPVTRQWTPSTEWEANPRMAIISIPSDGSDPILLRDNNGNLQTASHTEIEWGKSLSSWISNIRRYAGALEPDNYTKPDGIKANIANKNFPNIAPGQAKTWDPTFSGTQGTRVDPNIPSTISDLEGIAQADPSRRAAFEKEYAEKTRMFTSKPLLKDYLMKQRNLNPDEWEIDFSYDSEKSSSGTDMFFLKELNLIHKDSGETVPFTGEALAEIQSGYLNYISVGQPTTDEFPTGTFPATGAWSVPGAPQTGAAGAIAGYGQPATGMADTPLGANLAAPGIPMPGSLQQQALSRVDLSKYRQALPAAMPGGDIPLMRGLYRTPLSLAQNAYSLATQMGAFSPANIPGGTGAHEFQQYLGMQPDWRGDLQRGLAAIETVKQKIISGISPSQLSDAEKAIYTSYIGGTEDNPYAGSERELALRQQLTQMLPMPLRQSAFQNLQNIYNQALATRPTTVGGMPQAFMYGGSGSPFRTMPPMQISGSTPSVQNIPTGQSVSMDTMGENTAVTGMGSTTTQASDGSTVQFKRTADGRGTIATIVSKPTTSSRMGVSGVNTESHGMVMVRKDAQGKVEEIWQLADGKKVPVDITPSELGVPLSDRVINQRAMLGYGANDNLQHLTTGIGKPEDSPGVPEGDEIVEGLEVPDATGVATTATPIKTATPSTIPKEVTSFDIDPSKKVISTESYQTPESLWRDKEVGYPTLSTTTRTTKTPKYIGPTWEDVKNLGTNVLAADQRFWDKAGRHLGATAAAMAGMTAPPTSIEGVRLDYPVKSLATAQDEYYKATSRPQPQQPLPRSMGPDISSAMAIKNQQYVINHIRALDAARGMYMGVGGANVPPTIPPLANPSQMTRLTNPQAAIINRMANLSQVPQGIGTIGAINPNPYANQYTDRVFWPGLFNKSNISFQYR